MSMQKDNYDLPHETRFVKFINIYSNSNIEYIVNKYVEENYIINKDFLKKNIIETINDIKTSLKILDSRIITSISARILNNTKISQTWNLITVYRGNEEENNNSMIL